MTCTIHDEQFKFDSYNLAIFILRELAEINLILYDFQHLKCTEQLIKVVHSEHCTADTIVLQIRYPYTNKSLSTKSVNTQQSSQCVNKLFNTEAVDLKYI